MEEKKTDFISETLIEARKEAKKTLKIYDEVKSIRTAASKGQNSNSEKKQS